ncbi:MAG: DUF2723 domain-containing protein [Muribaculaceae bacterium]|nr:DUF2723 domain-containing protein [Muribaculaceae bacterium]
MKIAFERHKVFRMADRAVSWGVFIILLLTYWLTVPPTVSLWDCPEYVTSAWRLEPGHPPGNPLWMLVERIFTLFVPGKYAALAINLSSGLFTALAGMLLAKCIFIGAVWVLKTRDGHRRRLHALYAAGAATVGALAFGWCDSVWYSAVEAEVYAMSIFLTALSVWLMLKWARAANVTLAWRYLILLAYVFGLSLGVHQLNLLVIPALAVVWALRRGIHSIWRIAVIALVSLAAVGCVLVGMMPSTIAIAAEMELFAANVLGLPLLTGVAAYILILGITLIVALTVTRRSSNKGALTVAIFHPLFMSGLFIFAGNFLAGAAISALAAIIIVRTTYFKPHRLNLMMWMLAMILTGYSAYALIPIRGNIPAPPNAAMPGNPFSFAAYQAREQYGAAPLLYGNTPYSVPMLIEEFDSDSTPRYSRYMLEKTSRQVEPYLSGAVIGKSSVPLSSSDSAMNKVAVKKGKAAYIVRGYNVRYVLTPELDMWFPRITSRDPLDLDSYRAWGGMEKDAMTDVEITEAVDSTGRFVPKMGADGKRVSPHALRPTYLQNMQYLFCYQIGYMYLRYLMWNFAGRQNDIPSTGEVEHGNFITGFPVIDNAMLEAEDALPPHAGSENKGRNRYFMLPLLLGIWGIVWMLRSNWRGRMACGVVTSLFIMTGVAIVVYLNQTPGEPRERDYTFLGSYMAFAIWIGAGALGLSREIAETLEKLWKKRHGFRLRRMIAAALLGFIPSFGVVALMVVQNYDDHDRSGRRVASRYAYNVLMSLDPDAIIFVDGDNYTFPLWYAQEVEGVRRDVRVINLSYLSNPRYAAMILREWDKTKPLNSVLKAPDLIYHAHISDGVDNCVSDTVEALKMLEALKANPSAKIKASFVRIPLESGEQVTLPVTALSRSGNSGVFEFRKLMMLDLIASNVNPENGKNRPVYWQKNVASNMFMNLMPYLSERTLAYRLGIDSKETADSALLKLNSIMLPPNDTHREVYMDRTPAGLVARLRADLTVGARRLLRNGYKQEALELAVKTNRDYGINPYSFQNVKMGDTIFVTQREFADLLFEIADSTGRDDIRVIAQRHINAYNRKNKGWERYRETLSPSMRLNMSKSP